MHELKKLINNVSIQLYTAAFLQCALLFVAVYLPVAAFNSEASVWPVLAGFLAAGIGFWQTGIFQNKKQQAISLIHAQVGQAEYSLHLLDKEELNLAEQLQLERLADQQVVFPYVRLYKSLGWYAGLLALSVVFYWMYPLIANRSAKAGIAAVNASEKKPAVNTSIPPVFQNAEVRITPPAYTGLTVSNSKDMNISAVSGSQLVWQLHFSHHQKLVVKLANSRGEEVVFKDLGSVYQYSDKLTGSGLYAFKAYWRDSLVYQSDFYRLEALPDLPPKIEPASKELYKYHFLKDSKSLNIAAKISDDFRVRQAFIVATVARGSGENVKFREMKFPLSPADFKEANLQKTIDLKALNFTPGDELYYYWAAVDNRQPEANFSKSDTYFVVYKDTAQVEEAELATMAVNIMPEYFRSQRQIIIDTEKLIARKKKISKKEFNSISNEIGFDQKVLRLRYGQYLGEEFETSLGGAAGPPAEGESGGNILDAFTHKSDGEGEAAERRASEPDHDHGHDHDHGSSEGDSKDPLAALMEQYVHAHDDAETNTFYEQSTRSLLKMALENMWQSELHLRMYEPEKAIPFENKALEFLKSAQHKARTFVKKSGYDPPPIKEKEKRLTGEMKDLNKNLSSEKNYREKTTGQLVAEVLGYLQAEKLSGNMQSQMQIAGSVLSERLLNSGPFNGGPKNWKVLASLQKMVSAKPLSEKEKMELKNELYKRADKALERNKGYRGEQKLEGAFWKMMQ
ncbi:hypothetical protein DSL64_07655 [Dyadobacter luteus]|jgi:hypothetical protein|uniref:DUF4175 domain-containing protein n=1 Tax=Dyadobacter luteus TaxID=2259619 RepID=A0A3D8YEU6_9BACT|nr:hypothetical protein [Dyadobacter luteus]REA62788.1 hypothetical protein DSL64_07655 [Dyadobacter luteus]